ncbi:carbonic anhydrase [Desulfurobacterium pacificum]|jgi:carbonic anhydrase|uniref:Carbonic anhydrase n=1 Tax=Desulfurobacterium pacificum TaxID=240166 RepID=A0ABY1NXN4_9BACT|nr:carbonic anhydrase [Desulfurobacterium pacificum]SMP19520.1 carbonic anhydrase [Desulfurobacterium pacificum]
MEAVKVIEKLLLRDCAVKEEPSHHDCCIVTTSSIVWRLSSLFPESYIIANSAVQAFPNLTSIYYAVKELSVPLVAIAGSSALDLEKFVSFEFQASEVEFKLLKKIYEENSDIIVSLYEEDEKSRKAALMEINIDVQIEKLLSIPELSEKIEKKELLLCGFVLDEACVYGERSGFYLINLNGLKDPEEIRNSDLLSSIPESLKERKIKRIHLQF